MSLTEPRGRRWVVALSVGHAQVLGSNPAPVQVNRRIGPACAAAGSRQGTAKHDKGKKRASDHRYRSSKARARNYFTPIGTPPIFRSSASGSGGMGRRLGLWGLAAKFNLIGSEPIDAGGVSPVGERPSRRSRPAILRSRRSSPPASSKPPGLAALSSFCQSLLLATILMNEFRQAASEFRHYSRTAHIINPRTWNLLSFSPFRPDIGEHAR